MKMKPSRSRSGGKIQQASFAALKGVWANATACGIKPGRDDLSYIYLPGAHSSAGVFTRNSTAAPCIEYSRAVLASGKAKGVIINAGCANAATGTQGFRNAQRTAGEAAKLLGCSASEIAVASTGIIGKQLPMEKVSRGLKALFRVPLKKDGQRVARAIMTTDTFPKEVTVRGKVGGSTVTISGIAKGAGMIAPNMATMLGFLVTDARIESKVLKRLLQQSVNASFNMTSVDTDTSTNDLVLLFSSGEVPLPKNAHRAIEQFATLLQEACERLAKLIARDGEGATKLIEVNIGGAKNDLQARRMAMNVVNSPLVKTAIAGADPNWGRVIAAAGKDPDLQLDLKRLDVRMGGILVMKSGRITRFKHTALASQLRKDEVDITLDLKLGRGKARAWGCDLTEGYVEINTDYN